MSGPVARRSFLKLMSAAPAGLKHLAERVAKAEATAAAATATVQAGIAPLPASGLDQITPYYLLRDPKIAAAVRSNIMPDWLREDIGRSITSNARHTIPADVGAMRSVSLSAKIIIANGRQSRRAWADLREQQTIQLMRELFFGEQDARSAPTPIVPY